MVNYKLLLSLIMILSSCNCNDDDELQLMRMDYSGVELRTDGYYFSEFDSSEPSITIYFLYKNGIILYGSSPNVSDITSVEEMYENGEFYSRVKSLKYHWGVFNINNNDVEFERWYPSEPPVETWVRSGEILNDTTFRITKSYKPDGSDEVERDELYHFKAFSPKPDSTNMFIN